MARVTVEDCVGAVPNRFDLVLLSAQRARELSAGADALVAPDKDKNGVIALREIAEEAVVPAEVQENIVKSLQMRTMQEEMEQEAVRVFAPRTPQPDETDETDDEAETQADVQADSDVDAGADAGAEKTEPATEDAEESAESAESQEAEESADKAEAGKAEDAEPPGAPLESMDEDDILDALRKQSDSTRGAHEMRGGDD